VNAWARARCHSTIPYALRSTNHVHVLSVGKERDSMSGSRLTDSASPTLSDSYVLLSIGHGAASKRIYIAVRDVQNPNNTGYYQWAVGSGRLLVSQAEYAALRSAFTGPHSITLTYDDTCLSGDTLASAPVNNVKTFQYLSTTITFVLDATCLSAIAAGRATSPG